MGIIQEKIVIKRIHILIVTLSLSLIFYLISSTIFAEKEPIISTETNSLTQNELIQKIQLVEIQIKKSEDLLNNNEAKLSIENALKTIQIIETYSLPDTNKIDALEILANALGQIGAFKEALLTREMQVNLIDSVGYSKNRWILTSVGGIYYQLHNYDSSIYYFKKVDALYKDNVDLSSGASLVNNIALAYYQNDQLDSAKYYFSSAHKMLSNAANKPDSIMLSLVGLNLSKCYELNSENELVINKLISSSLVIAKKNQITNVIIDSYLRVGKLNIGMSNYNLAKSLIDSANLYVSNEVSSKAQNLARLRVLESSIYLFEEKHDYKNALRSQKLFQAIHNSLYGNVAMGKMSDALISYSVSTIQNALDISDLNLKDVIQKNKALKQDEDLSNMRITLIVVIGVSLLLIATVLIVKLRNDMIKRNRITELNDQIYQTTIQTQTEKLTAAALGLTRKMEFSHNLISKLSAIDKIHKRELLPIEQFVSNELQMDQSFIDTEKNIAKLSKDFSIKLKVDFPQLSEKDIKLCGLVRLKLSNKQIAIMKFITPNSAKLARSRLRKKMGLKTGTSLYEFLKSY